MIRLFVTDLDGCVSYPFHPPAWDAVREIARLHDLRHRDAYIPPLTLCTGRPLAYAEAVAQWLAVQVPILFESGSGMYDPVRNQLWWSPHITERTERTLAILRQVIHGDVATRYPGTVIEFAKQKDVGVTNPDAQIVAAMRSVIDALVAQHDGDGDLEVHDTPVSVNVIPRAANKGAGLQWLATHLDIDLAEMAYIGDTRGDISALEKVGLAFAPANASSEVKALATVTDSEATAGVLEAYRAVIEHNRQCLGDA